MTRYFEVQHRDGAARIGKFLLGTPIQTPCIIDTGTLGNPEKGTLIDAGSLWRLGSKKTAEKRLNEMRSLVGEDTLIIHPHQSFPPAVPDDVALKAAKALDFTDSGAVGVTLRSGQQPGKSDLYVMEGAGCFENNARDFLNTLIELKNNVPADTAVYAPAICLPENVAILVYLGIDVVDDTRTVIAAYNDIYLTSSGRFYLDSLSELPCRCEACASVNIQELREMGRKERAEILIRHNRNVLVAELALVRERIRAGTLREYVEGQCRTRPWLTALLRLSDFEYNYMEERTPIVRSGQLIANTGESLTRVEVVRFAERVLERYNPPDVDILLLLPCSAKKPYSTSNSHHRFVWALGKNRRFVHEVIITSPLGIVPRELELTYPAAHYDIAVTGYWDAEEREWVGDRLFRYLSKHRYSYIVAHVEGAYREICESVAEKLGIGIVYTSCGNVISQESLSSLRDTIEGLCSGRTRTPDFIKKELMRAVADYQFGSGAGGILIPDNAVIKATYPKYQVFIDKNQVATLVPQYGTLALTIAGAELLQMRGKYIVKIDDFVPKGSILAPGVVEADPQIRPNDEVIVSGSKAVCVGRALMGGKEMQDSTRGVAVDLRHVKKKK
jgi:archaeosine synthase